MKEKIARKLAHQEGWLWVDGSHKAKLCLARAEEILSLFQEEIEGLGNPHVAVTARNAFEICRRKVLMLLSNGQGG